METIQNLKAKILFIVTLICLPFFLAMNSWFSSMEKILQYYAMEVFLVVILAFCSLVYFLASLYFAKKLNNYEHFNGVYKEHKLMHISVLAIIIIISLHIALTTNARREAILWKAINYGNAQLVNSMLDKGVDPNIKNEELYTPLAVAVDNGSTDIVIALLNHKANLNPVGTNILSIALDNEMDRITKILINAGANTDFKNSSHYQNLYKQYLQRQNILKQ